MLVAKKELGDPFFSNSEGQKGASEASLGADQA